MLQRREQLAEVSVNVFSRDACRPRLVNMLLSSKSRSLAGSADFGNPGRKVYCLKSVITAYLRVNVLLAVRCQELLPKAGARIAAVGHGQLLRAQKVFSLSEVCCELKTQ